MTITKEMERIVPIKMVNLLLGLAGVPENINFDFSIDFSIVFQTVFLILDIK